MTPYVVALVLALLVAHVLVTAWLVRALRRVRGFEDRLSHLSTALALLTETAETGFGTMAAEIERLGLAASRPATTRATTARMARAARRGRSVQDIAASEQVSEGEVRLRLHLAEAARLHAPGVVVGGAEGGASARAARRGPDGALRS